MFAMVFPGQGSQSVGMMSNFDLKEQEIKNTFNSASSILGYDLLQLIQNGPTTELNKTYITQPALLACSTAIYRLWIKNCDKKPKLIAGHSLGEYTALVCSGVIKFTEAIKLVELRGILMQESVPEGIGAMKVIIGLNNNLITQACKESSGDQVVNPVNFNSPEQVVISGHKEAVERATVICKKMGAKLILSLPISVPAHSILMKSASNKLNQALKKIKFKKPNIPIINNVDVKYLSDPYLIKKALVRQIYNPVLWVDVIKFITKKINHLIEIGPGKILTKLSKKIVNNIKLNSINSQKNLLTIINNLPRSK